MRQLMLAMILAWTLLATLSWILLLPHNAPVVATPHNAHVVSVPHNAPVVSVPHNAPVVSVPHNAPVVTVPHNAPVVPLPKTPKELLCELKTCARLRTVDGTEEPFSSLGWSSLVPSSPLVPSPPPVPSALLVPSAPPPVPSALLVPSAPPPVPSALAERFHRLRGNRSCAVVASAGAMLRSGLGEEIDSHEEVMRFNHAPTAGYEKDVGTRTTFRLINQLIQNVPKFRFGNSSLYRNVTLVTWALPGHSQAPHDLNLSVWYADGKMFGPYVTRRRLDPAQPFYVLHPSYVRQLWQAIQGNAPWEHITRNPPSSGFIGILVMMALCDEVHVYEYIPSVARQTALCHYFERGQFIGCSLGGPRNFHPIEFEKRLIRRINTGSETDLRRGRVTLPGFSSVNCD